MKKGIILPFLLLVFAGGLLFAVEAADKAVHPAATEPERLVAEATAAPTKPVMPTTVPTETPTEASTEATEPPAWGYTKEEDKMLLKLAMAERGDTECVTCMALVMRTVLNRVEGPKFSSTVKGVLYAQDQFTPVADGSFDLAAPSKECKAALKMLKEGWDESQGALYYEWCEGESWHSKNLNLLLQHCDTRFYN